jgi:hypothetical protein
MSIIHPLQYFLEHANDLASWGMALIDSCKAVRGIISACDLKCAQVIFGANERAGVCMMWRIEGHMLRHVVEFAKVHVAVYIGRKSLSFGSISMRSPSKSAK